MDINKDYKKYKQSNFQHRLLDTLFDICFKQRDKLHDIREILNKPDYAFLGYEYTKTCILEVLDT